MESKFMVKLISVLLFSFFLVFIPEIQAQNKFRALVKASKKSYHNSADRNYSSQELLQDFNLLETALKERHPGLFWYAGDQVLNKKFGQIKELLSDTAMTEIEFFRLVSPLIASIRCGHTSLYPSYNYIRHHQKHDKRLPFTIKILEKDNAFITKNYSDEKVLGPGTEILTINGKNIREITNTILPNLSTDGFNKTFKLYNLNQSFAEYYYYYVNQTDSFEIEYKLPGSEKVSKTVVPAITFSDLYQVYFSDNGNNDEPLYEEPLNYELLEDQKTGIITLKTFDRTYLRYSGYRFRKFLRKSFRDMKKNNAEHLVIDLRGNGGGYSLYGSKLFAYICDTSFHYIKDAEYTTNDRISYIRFTDKPRIFNLFFKLLSSSDSGKYYLNVGPDLKLQKPKKNRFKGKVYVLIDGGSFSNSANFSALASQHKRTVLIGEETGGGYHGFTAGPFLFLTLPFTHINIQIPMAKYMLPVSGSCKGHGVVPDHIVKPSIEDILNGTDRELKFTLELIEQESSNPLEDN